MESTDMKNVMGPMASGNHDRQRVLESIEVIGVRSDEVSREFYRELFQRDIGMKKVFPGNVVTLNRKFFNMLSTFGQIEHLEKISASVEKMGERHFQKYGAMIEHFDLFEESLIVAFKSLYQDKFTVELEHAWRRVFADVSAIMKRMLPDEAQLRDGTSEQDQNAGVEVPSDFLTRIGGAEKVHQVHIRFYREMFADPWLGQFFYGKHESVLAQKQSEFMVAAFGGPNEYTGDTPAFVHMHMYVTADVADFRESLLRQAILAEGLSEAEADIWLSVDSSFRPSIVKEDISECVMKCRGQMPVKARKPDDYV